MGYIREAIENGYLEHPGLHVVLTTCLRFFSVLGGACVACCLVLSTIACNVPTVLGPVLQHIVSVPKKGD